MGSLFSAPAQPAYYSSPPGAPAKPETEAENKTREKPAMPREYREPSDEKKERLSFEEFLEELTGQPTVREGQVLDKQTIKGAGYGTEDKGYIPDPSFMLPKNPLTFFGESSSFWQSPRLRPTPRPAGKGRRIRGDVREGMMVVRKKAEANILKDMSIEDIFGELINKYKISPNEIMSDADDIKRAGSFQTPLDKRNAMKALFAKKLADQRINMGYPLDIPEI
jgi:hypothetical protein